VTQQDAKSACPSSDHNAVTLPAVGSHVAMTGTYVRDDNHQHWMEAAARSIVRQRAPPGQIKVVERIMGPRDRTRIICLMDPDWQVGRDSQSRAKVRLDRGGLLNLPAAPLPAAWIKRVRPYVWPARAASLHRGQLE
jgi:hypothetical protein